MNTDSLSRALDELDASEMEHLAAALHERARIRRVPLSYDEGLDAFKGAPVSTWAAQSPYADVARVRATCRILVAERRWHESQIVEAMLTLAFEVCPHPLIAREAVAQGIADAKRISEGRANGE
jgi:hypothetical protein